ncbi:glycosyltransferase [Sphingobacterium deserti]|uniref:Putative lipopolysaccharide biosynthesis glycosyltransferase n=1 Tax=Sphingobacterium deserti TaxID=1229276 RepID=A0A0B8T0X0_9SPHI|nr:glycosyltransferase [Sphingobacterium deserti]KGE14161.1 putative lipopolysaccharide biosynthesis glycosyltransferase [Sphingobacterium deserti]
MGRIIYEIIGTIDPMKVLQLGKFYPIRGGVEKVMYDLMLGLSETGVHCDMLCASTEDHAAGTIKINEFANLFVVPTQLSLAATKLAPAMISRLRNIAKQYDIIHVHHPDPMACLALFLSGYKGKVLLHWHSDILKQKVLLKAYAPLQRWLIKRADRILGTTPKYVSESPFLQKVQHKTGYIPIGVEPLQPEAALVEKIQKRYPGKKIIFSLGRLVSYKGYEYLIKAALKLSDDYCVVIGGKGPLQQSLEALIVERGLQQKVFLVGYIPDEEIPAYFAAANQFCLPSILKTEAFAIVQIEAMSCGRPVVSTDIPGSGVSWVNQDGESGLIAPIEDANALAEKILQIGEDDERYQRLAAGAKNRYNTCFTRVEMVKVCLGYYQEVL